MENTIPFQKTGKALFWFLFIGTFAPYPLFFYSASGTGLEGVGVVVIAPVYILLDVFGLLALKRRRPSGYALLFVSNIIKAFAVVIPGITGLVTGSIYTSTPSVIYGYIFIAIMLVTIFAHAIVIRRQEIAHPSAPVKKSRITEMVRKPNKYLRFPLQVLFAIIFLGLGFAFEKGDIVHLAIVILIIIFVVDRLRNRPSNKQV